MRVAAAAYPVERPADWDAYATKARAWVAGASAQGTDLLVFPEYALIEPALAAVAADPHAVRIERAGATLPVPEVVAAAVDLWPHVGALWQGLAADHGVTILAGSGPAAGRDGPVNRALLVTPDGGVGHQDKLILTPWERAGTPLRPGTEQTVFETALGRIGILVCYDAEFPLNARALIEAGAEILLIPACTDALTGATRVDVAARARALEGSAVSVLSMLVGAVPECPLVDSNIGWGAVYAPPDLGWPADGVLARGDRDAAGWVHAAFGLPDGDAPRAVDIPAHWPEQPVKPAATQRL